MVPAWNLQQELDLNTGKKNYFQFTPHLTPMFRGILTTIYVDLKYKVTQSKIISTLKKKIQELHYVDYID